jgi:2-methylisocitrate lyase-like PEP mutase family enzyme
MNLEDSDHHGESVLVSAEWNAERLAAVKEQGRREGVDLFLNARVDVFVHRLGSPDEQFTEGLRRARLYKEAGADCIYPISLSDEAMISGLVKEVGPLNVNVRRGGPLSLERAAGLGVRRVTYATSLFRDTMTELERLAQEVFAATPPV